jgi:dTDP-4-dehydrorhamnose reductase
LLGADGQLGSQLRGPLGCFVELSCSDLRDTDVTDPEALRAKLDACAPQLVVNASAYTNVDGAEREPELAHAINSTAVAQLGELCLQRRIGMIHVSTDFVFDGRGDRPYREDDPTAPLSVYGASKLAGEQALAQMGAPAIVLRTAWLYSLERNSFVSAILRAARLRETLTVVSDQQGNPTWSRDLASAIAALVGDLRAAPHRRCSELAGVYHLTGGGITDRLTLARSAIELDPDRAEHMVRAVEATTTAAFDDAQRAAGRLSAPRPLYSALDGAKAAERLGLQLPPWREALARALAPRCHRGS